MKKLLLTTALFLIGTTATFAAKANPKPRNVVQSDGTTLTVYTHGDENFHWTTAEDGTLLVPVGKYYYVAQVETDGTLKATPQLAHNSANRNATERKAVSLQDKAKFLSTASDEWTALAKANASTISTNKKYFPHTGTPKALVILVQFADLKFVSNDPKTVFDYFFNAEMNAEAPAALTDYYNSKGTNYGSVKEYFKAMSNEEYAPQFDVAGVVTLAKNYAYYGQDSGSKHDIYYTDMIKEACQLAQSELSVNLKDYDQDGDGQTDLIYFIYAGLGQNNGGDANTIWAKTSSNIEIGDGQHVANYTMASELNPTPDGEDGKYITGMGVVCHEFTHCLGIPDLYATNPAAYVNNQSPEFWDLMDAGEYMNEGYLPNAYSPWETSVMEWNIDIETLDGNARQITMEPYYNSKKVYKIEAPDDTQYLLLQNLQKDGWWRGYPTHGLLIQRIDYEGEVNLNNKLNNTPGAPNVTILPADGIIINEYLAGDGLQYTYQEYAQSHYGDPFPGRNNVTSLTEVTLNSRVVNNETKEVTMSNLLYNIKEENGTVSFDYLKDYASGINHTDANSGTADSTDKRIFTLDGRYAGTDSSTLPKGVYIIGKKKVTVK